MSQILDLFAKKNRQDINLIPEEKQVLKTRRSKRGLVVFAILIVILFFVIWGAVFIFKQTAVGEAARIDRETTAQRASWQKNSSVAASLKEIKTKLPLYKQVGTADQTFETRLKKIAAATPEKVQILNLSITALGKTQVSARADSASSAYQFIEVLKSQKDSFANFSLTSLQKASEQAEVKLTFSLDIK